MAERTIKHGLFYYHEDVDRIIAGETKTVKVERLAFHGETVDITNDVDLERGEEQGAFYSDEELAALARPAAAPAAQVEAGTARDPKELDDEELVDWLMGTGEFDGHPKPTVEDVNAAIGDDGEFGDRVLEAEDTASGGKPRKGIVDHVESLEEA